MRQLDLLRISLLAGLTGCLSGLESAQAGGQTTTSQGSGLEEVGESEEGTPTTAEDTGEDPVCEFGCEDPTHLVDGLVQCPDGKINRIGGGSFDPTITAPSCEGYEEYLGCTSDAECTEGSFGKCIHAEGYDEQTGTMLTSCYCAYSCASDDDCAGGSICLPPFVVEGTADWPTCLPGGCTIGSDCGECGECGLAAFHNGCHWEHKLACRTAGDLCSSDADCEAGGYCSTFFDAWDCQYPGCAIGRPLLVDAVPCTAAPRSRSDWSATPTGLPEDPELAAWWAEVAALEHASVASFARFGTQLLALGAPADLVRASKRAALDEIEHARLAYGLASAYGGAPVGPGQLRLQGVSTAATWREVVRGLIEEACVGETLGVAEAVIAAEVVRVPAVREVLERIAADELRHAQLAWRALAWLLREADEVDRAWAKTLLERAIWTASEVTGETHRPADGVLGGPSRAQVHHEARVRVLAPLARALGLP
jgi:hypothetical protein